MNNHNNPAYFEIGSWRIHLSRPVYLYSRFASVTVCLTPPSAARNVAMAEFTGTSAVVSVRI
jgi:hypothetical protein